MSTSLPSVTPVSGTSLTGTPGTELTAFWTITGVVALAAATGVYEVIVHLLGS